ncbi:hypothetical protein ACLB1O_12330 [Escherichia coli]
MRVNKKRIKPEYKLEAGDEVRIDRFALLSGKKRRFRHICKRWRRWRTSILYEDDHPGAE